MDVGKYIGIPYKDRGRSFDAVDCYGLIYLIYRNEFGINVPSYSDEYTNEIDVTVWDTLTTNAADISKWDNVEGREPKAGDLVIFNIKGHPRHVGLMVSAVEFIHAYAGRNACIERIDSVTWRHRIYRRLHPC